MHHWGKITTKLRQNAETLKKLKKLNMITIGQDVDLAEMKTLFAGSMGVAGNIDHLQLLPHGTPQEVEESCRRAIKQGKVSPGFMLAPGCEITADTPPESIQAFVQSAVKYGNYT